MTNRQPGQILYWLIGGALIGLGLLGFDVYFIFIPCVIVGLIMLIVGIKHWGAGRLWAAFLGFGILPALFLLNDILSSYPPCPPQGLSIPAGAPPGTTVLCGFVPIYYYVMLAFFILIALVAGAWPLLRRRFHR